MNICFGCVSPVPINFSVSPRYTSSPLRYDDESSMSDSGWSPTDENDVCWNESAAFSRPLPVVAGRSANIGPKLRLRRTGMRRLESKIHVKPPAEDLCSSARHGATP